MSKYLQSVFGMVALAIGAAVWLVAWEAARTLQSFNDAAVSISSTVADANLAATTDRLNATLDAINGPRGTLHEINKAVVKAGDAIVTTQIQERAITPHTIAAVDALATIAPHINSLAQDGSATLRTANSSIEATKPLLESLTRASDASTLSIQHLDALLTSKDLADAITNAQFTTQNVAGVTFNLKRVSDKAADDYLRPKTPWQRIGTTTLDLIHLGAWAAR